MANVYQVLGVQGADFPDTGFPAWTRKTGTARAVSGLAYDASSTETCYIKGKWVNYGSGTCTVDIDWWSDSSSTNNVVWSVQFIALTPGDASNMVTRAWDTKASSTDANAGQMYLNRAPVAVPESGLDGVADGDFFSIAVYREAGNGSDDLAADAVIEGLRLTYSDT